MLMGMPSVFQVFGHKTKVFTNENDGARLLLWGHLNYYNLSQGEYEDYEYVCKLL